MSRLTTFFSKADPEMFPLTTESLCTFVLGFSSSFTREGMPSPVCASRCAECVLYTDLIAWEHFSQYFEF